MSTPSLSLTSSTLSTTSSNLSTKSFTPSTALPTVSSQSVPTFKPKDDADIATRLRCLLLNALKPQTRLHDPRHVAPSHGLTSKFRYGRNSIEVRNVGLREYPNLDKVVVGVAWSTDDESGYKNQYLRGQVWIDYLDEDAEEEEEDFFMEIKLHWDVCLVHGQASRNALAFCRGLEWEELLTVLERYAKVIANKNGEERPSDEATAVDARLKPVFPEMLGLSRIRWHVKNGD